jgi:hypothetical protein
MGYRYRKGAFMARFSYRNNLLEEQAYSLAPQTLMYNPWVRRAGLRSG